mgnify:CR=1 FL=1
MRHADLRSRSEVTLSGVEEPLCIWHAACGDDRVKCDKLCHVKSHMRELVTFHVSATSFRISNSYFSVNFLI